MSKCGELLKTFCTYNVPGDECVEYSEQFIDLSDEEAETLASKLILEIKEKYKDSKRK